MRWILIFATMFASAPALSFEQNDILEEYKPPVHTEPAGSSVTQTTSENLEIDWSVVENFRCDGTVDDVIHSQTIPLSGGHAENASLIAEKRRIYNWVDIREGLIVFSLRAENDYATKGTTMCVCAELQDGTFNNFPVAAMGGRYGLNGRTKRSDRKTLQVDPRIAGMITQVKFVGGYCPSDRILKKVNKTIAQVAWKMTRAYATSKGIPLPENP